MGRGSALLLGFELPDNFNFPYLARSLQDFWRRWHMSLSTWLRDYLYIPLGGSKGAGWSKYKNLIVTMVLGGLWHGAAWHFVVWGAIHGVGLAVNHWYDRWIGQVNLLKNFHTTAFGVWCSSLLTFAFVVMGWIFFRAETTADALTLIQALLIPRTGHVLDELLCSSTVGTALVVYGFYAVIFCWPNYSPADRLAASVSSYEHPAAVPLGVPLRLAIAWAKSIQQYCSGMGIAARVSLCCGIVLAVIGFAPVQTSPFIYFQF
jgi:alginate O-acetyltransferase complex protein AlgI